ncbi:MAG: hypothetical protein BWY86_01287 [Candidatus Aminicenantes bacterium ADurb.Bin508]|nr:MAG: hypothetical protein BWY86_01287 [Candidatus Aminicenantes bacterium ADurb.Bin508]
MVSVDRHVGRIVDPLQVVSPVEPFSQTQDLKIALRGGSDDQLGALPGGDEEGSAKALLPLQRQFPNPLSDIGHRGQDVLLLLLRCQDLQGALGGKLDVHAHPVHQEPCPPNKLKGGSGNALHVDVAVVPSLEAELGDNLQKLLHSGIRRPHHGGTEKEPLNVVALVEAHGEVYNLVYRESRPGDIVAPAVKAVGAIVDADVGEEYLEEGDATAVVGPTVADSRSVGVADGSFRLRGSLAPAGRARGVIFGRVGQNSQFPLQFHFDPSPPL